MQVWTGRIEVLYNIDVLASPVWGSMEPHYPQPRDSRRETFAMHQVLIVNPDDEWWQDSEDKTSWLTHL